MNMGGMASWKFTKTATTNALVVVEVVNRRMIWAAGGDRRTGDEGTVVRTIDGGLSWLNVTPPDGATQEFRNVKAFDADHALLLAVGEGSASRIYRTVDGGTSWQLVFTNPDENAFYDGMAFFDDRRGLAVSDAVDGTFPILATADGGSTWNLVPSDGIPAALDGEFLFASGTSLVTVGRNDAWFGTTATDRNPRIFHTNDGGITWTVADTPIPGSPLSEAGLRSLSFRNRRQGLAVSGTPPTADPVGVGIAAYTSDGGNTWDLVGAPTAFRNGVAWVSGQTAVVVGNPGSDLSTDAGETWTRFDDEFLLGVSCSSPPVCWAVGDGGMAARLVR
jgi:photosystem II stability/assembly factor-like uncharacterized protein